MSQDTGDRVREIVEAVYRAESRRVFDALIRLLGDFDLAEAACRAAGLTGRLSILRPADRL
jgi:RNA polymerase sigma-70 factor (ECF subfamily)